MFIYGFLMCAVLVGAGYMLWPAIDRKFLKKRRELTRRESYDQISKAILRAYNELGGPDGFSTVWETNCDGMGRSLRITATLLPAINPLDEHVIDPLDDEEEDAPIIETSEEGTEAESETEDSPPSTKRGGRKKKKENKESETS